VESLLLLCLLCLFGLLSTPVNNLDVIVEYRGDDWHHVCLHHSCPHILRSSDADINNALERQIPLPHVHHILTPPRLEQAYQSFDASIDCEDVPYPGGGGGQVSEMVERIDERQGRRAIEGSAVIQGCCDTDRGLVDIGDAEIDFPHDGVVPHNRGERRVSSSMGVSAGFQQWDIYFLPGKQMQLVQTVEKSFRMAACARCRL